MLETDLIPDQPVILGLATHIHHGVLWKKLPQKHVTHEPSEAPHWMLVDPSACITTLFPKLTSDDSIKAIFLEIPDQDPEVGWGGTLAKVKIGNDVFFVDLFLVNCNPNLTLPSINPETNISVVVG